MEDGRKGGGRSESTSLLRKVSASILSPFPLHRRFLPRPPKGMEGGGLDSGYRNCRKNYIQVVHTVRRPMSPTGLHRDIVYLGWPIAPSYMSPNAGGGGELRGLSQWVQLDRGAQINFRDLTPYLTYDVTTLPKETVDRPSEGVDGHFPTQTAVLTLHVWGNISFYMMIYMNVFKIKYEEVVRYTVNTLLPISF